MLWLSTFFMFSLSLLVQWLTVHCLPGNRPAEATEGTKQERNKRQGSRNKRQGSRIKRQGGEEEQEWKEVGRFFFGKIQWEQEATRKGRKKDC